MTPRPVRALLLDVPLALFVAMSSVFAARLHDVSPAWGPPDGTDPVQDGPPWSNGEFESAGPVSSVLIVFVLLLAAAVAARRWRPRTAFVVSVVGAIGYLALGYPFGPVLFGPALILLAMATLTPVRVWAPWTALLLPVFLAGSWDRPYLGVFEAGPYRSLAFGLAVMLVPAALGALRRTRVETNRREREQELHRYAFEERLRIAREVHDVVGHSLSVITMQAGVALHVLHKRPEKVEASLEAIRRTSKDALDELRGTLAVFRDPGVDERAPLPGLERLDDLVAALGAAGRRTTVHVEGAAEDGSPPALPASVGHAAYRIIQEALTNVSRHARGADAVVRIAYGSAELAVEITDDGPSPSGTHREGNGISGMRERAHAVGGTLEAGPRPGGGFSVSVRIPVRGAEEAR